MSTTKAAKAARRARTAPFQAEVRHILTALGEDPAREGLVKTPERVEKAYRWLTRGYGLSVMDAVGDALFEEDHNSMILVRDIELYSLCEHHMLPFFGRAHVAYIPNDDGRVIGLSKFARLIDGYARRPQVQERLTSQVADALQNTLDPKGVMVVVEAEHLCMSMRGVRKAGSTTVTSAVRGLFRHNVATREEAMRFIQGR